MLIIYDKVKITNYAVIFIWNSINQTILNIVSLYLRFVE